jgi:putative intracellular protease/amidase
MLDEKKVEREHININILLFDDFETLDAFGPVEVLGHLSHRNSFEMHFISINGGIVKSRQGTEILTQSVNDIEQDGILVIPGGQGTRVFVNDEEFVKKLSEIASCSKYCLAICTGSALLAKTGLLDGRRATSNKRAFDWVKSVNKNVDWIPKARWVVDGKFYTSSGVSAGMDMAFGFIADIAGGRTAEEIANAIEYVWNQDKANDLFAFV